MQSGVPTVVEVELATRVEVVERTGLSVTTVRMWMLVLTVVA